MGGDQHIKRTYGVAFGFQKYPYFPIAHNQFFTVKRINCQWQQEFTEGILICIYIFAFGNTILQLCLRYRRNPKFMNRISFKFSQYFLWLFIYDVVCQAKSKALGC